MPRKSIEDRFLSYVVYAESGCWIWDGARRWDGYGRFQVGYSTLGAHCWSYQHWVGVIPPGCDIDHLCRVRACVRPDHLEAVTPKENTRRMQQALGIGQFATHCLRGHEFTPDNTYRRDGRRHCRECRAEWLRTYRSRKAAS